MKRGECALDFRLFIQWVLSIYIYPCDLMCWCLNRMRTAARIRLHYTRTQENHERIKGNTHVAYNAARTFLDRSSISKAFNFLKGRGIPTSEMIFLSPTRISNVPLRGRVEGSPRTQGYNRFRIRSRSSRPSYRL